LPRVDHAENEQQDGNPNAQLRGQGVEISAGQKQAAGQLQFSVNHSTDTQPSRSG
jgi:hypothetical protein